MFSGFGAKVSFVKNGAMAAALLAAIICLLAYLPTLTCGFINYDDPDYVLNNLVIRHLDWNLFTSAFTMPHAGYWMPLTWISFAIDYHFWRLNPLGYHLTNIVLHTVNSGLVVLIADRLFRQNSLYGSTASINKLLYPGMLLLAGLLFGLHPLRVESVAWVTERKDVLNGLFSFGSILFYLRYCQKKAVAGAAASEYILSLAFFVLSLTAKSVSVVIPAMLLVADWYPMGRLKKGNVGAVLVEKIPFLCLSALMTLLTFYYTAQSGFLITYEVFPFWQRFVVSGNAVFEYCRLLLYPIGILPFHMIPDPIPLSFAVKTAVVVILSCCCIFAGRKRPWICATWLVFIFPLLPVLAFFQNGDQAFAARFTYLPSVGPSIAAGAIIAVACRKGTGTARHFCFAVSSIFVIIIFLYVGITARLINVWKTPEAFWSRVIDLDPEVIAFKERGKIHYQNGEYNAAIEDYSAAMKIAAGIFRTTVFNLYAYRGDAFLAAGRYCEAVQDFTTAISMLPHKAYYYRRGLALSALGKPQAAAADFERSGPDPGPMGWFDKDEDSGGATGR